MKDKCYSQDIMQAFLDGELSSHEIETVVCHITVCKNCSALLQRIEEETAITFAALDEHFMTLVPTERMRTNLYRAIAEIEKPKKNFIEKVFGNKPNFVNPLVSAFASVLIIGGLFFAVWRGEENTAGNNLTAASVNSQSDSINKISVSSIEPVSQSEKVAAQSAAINSSKTNVTFSNRQRERFALNLKTSVIKTVYKGRESRAEKSFEQNSSTENVPLVAGEDAYLKTIASLNETVDKSKDEVLRPVARVAFEKDLATVNYAIKNLRQKVRKNPKNEAAREMLSTSYQNKIDMLTTVADNSEMVASLR